MEKLKLFTPIKIGQLTLPNRVMMSPMFSNSATRDGFVTTNTLKHYLARAQSGLGLIMVEHTSVNAHYLHPGNRLLVSDDIYIPGLRQLAQAIHESGTLVGLQIAHSIYAVGKKPEDLSIEEIYEIIDDFVQGAVRAKKAGYDLIEVHLAHTYTLADFVSRRTNQRVDEFGKNLTGRFRIIKEIITRIKDVLGENFPLFARFSADEFIKGGNTLKQTRYYAQEMENLGVDCLDVSCGVRFDDDGLRGYSDLRGKPPGEMNDGPNIHLAEDIKKHVSIPVIAVGKLGNPVFAEQVLQEGKADIIALARQLIADPLWVDKVRHNRLDQIHYCRYCNNCLYKRRGPDDPVVCLDVRPCAKCLTCLRICPYGIPQLNAEGRLEFDRDWCEECQLCVGICPARLVRFESWPLENITAKIGARMEENPQEVAAFYCGAETMPPLVKAMPPNAVTIEISCLAKLETAHMIAPFSKGAQKVMIFGCSDQVGKNCDFYPSCQWVGRKVERAKDILKGINIAETSITFVKTGGEDDLSVA